MTRLPDYLKKRMNDNSRLEEDCASDIEAALAKARRLENSNIKTGEGVDENRV